MSPPLRFGFRRLHYVAAWAREQADRVRRSRGRKRVGWITAETLASPPYPRFLRSLSGAVGMRVANNALWLNRNTQDLWNEIYRRGREYDGVVFFKAMDRACQAEAVILRGQGTKIIFDANVNYYDIWGEYDVADTCPTETQQRDAIVMTREADHVVADSSYIAEVAGRYNPRVTWIPDNVDLSLFRRRGPHSDRRPVRLVWSGVAKKADHLLLIRSVFAGLSGAELVLVSDERPAAAAELGRALPVHFVPYSDAAFARTLLTCDIIISPKRLTNAYEMGHTEYKITTGMAVGLPAVASRQASYVEAIAHAGGGLLATDTDEWTKALKRLIEDVALRADLGERAARTVRERYATAVTGTAYAEVLRGLLG